MSDVMPEKRPTITLLGRDQDGVSGVYALVDPRINVVMYVGQSENIGSRYRKHCGLGGWEKNFARMAWINELAQENLVPALRVLQICEWPEIDEIERRFIREFRAAGHAELNIADGGGGISINRAGKATRDDWIYLAGHFKATKRMLVELQTHLAKIVGTTAANRAYALFRRYQDLGIHLGDQASDRFPDWSGVSGLFQDDDASNPTPKEPCP